MPSRLQVLAVASLLPILLVAGGRGGASGGARTCPESNSLFCMELIAAPSYRGVSGYVELRRIQGPFTVSPTPDGRLQFELAATIAGLPPADSLGPYTHFVAWLSGPALLPMRRLGPVEDGETLLGVADLNRFLVLISAESDSRPDSVSGPAGPVVLRGQSPSLRLRPADFLEFALGAAVVDEPKPTGDTTGWTTVPMPSGLTMLPALMRLRPDVGAWLPEPDDWSGSVPESRPREYLRLSDGDTLRLEATPVRHRVRERMFTMYGFNGQVPGPLFEVPKDAEITVLFRNHIDWPTTIHWHGLRLDNSSDGVPGLTQDVVPPGGEFTYTLRFPDAGIYWYHPHHREDVLQDLGLYGNMIARSERPDFYGPVHGEEALLLDDLLVGASGLVPYGAEGATHMLNGRFGNLFLVNGEPDYTSGVGQGEVVRYYLTNVSNTRTFNLSFSGARMKVVGSDVGNFEKEAWVESVVIAPAERYVVHVRFDEAGVVPLLNRVQAIDHINARFFAQEDTLGVITVADHAASPDLSPSFDQLREPASVARDIDPYRQLISRPVDRTLVLEMRPRELPLVVERLMQVDSVWFSPVEWAGTMPMMNWMSTAANLEWVLRDPETGRENLDIDWRFEVGDVVKIRLHNRRDALHAMHHPIHLHGQRFLVVEQDGMPNGNLVWKDTALIPVGSTIDILLDVSNPGAWMLHCHIAEHLEAGMKMVFHVGSSG
jgi:FtsP/CotA-like multicopper oxidase with cupredoxin domain